MGESVGKMLITLSSVMSQALQRIELALDNRAILSGAIAEGRYPCVRSSLWITDSVPLYPSFVGGTSDRQYHRQDFHRWQWEASQPSHRVGTDVVVVESRGRPPEFRTSTSCWPSVYRAELYAILVACVMQSGNGVVVTDCKGAAIVANKLKAGLRKPRGRHSRI
eukprot:118173-Amphidinium_carterae.2